LIGYIEASGAGGISFTCQPEYEGLINVSAIRAMSRCRLNVRADCDNHAIQRAMSVRPDFITLVNLTEADKTVDPYSETVRNLVETIQGAEDFNLILRLKPEVRDLKAAYRLRVDEVELATEALAAQELQPAYLAELQKITLAARLATKNHLRVSVGGQLHRRLILAILEVIDVEFISVGRALLGQSLIDGFEAAMREFLTIIENK
jgi:pyridoxine 5'-phosphate synthase PdxJ